MKRKLTYALGAVYGTAVVYAAYAGYSNCNSFFGMSVNPREGASGGFNNLFTIICWGFAVGYIITASVKTHLKKKAPEKKNQNTGAPLLFGTGICLLALPSAAIYIDLHLLSELKGNAKFIFHLIAALIGITAPWITLFFTQKHLRGQVRAFLFSAIGIPAALALLFFVHISVDNACSNYLSKQRALQMHLR